jgi:hypothetical protein
MSVPQVFEVAIGLILVYYVLGAAVSTITQIVNESLQTRGAALQKYLQQAAGDKALDLTNLPQIKALRPIRYANWWSVFGAGTEEKKVERIPVSTLVDAFFDVSGLTCKQNLNPDELTALINTLPDSEAKKALLQWVQQGVTDLNDLRVRASDYFTGIMNQAALAFRARARSFVIVLSLLITLLFGTDSIQLAKDLWNDAGLRALANQQAGLLASQTGATAPAINPVAELGQFSLHMGWWQTASQTAGPTSPLDWLSFMLLKFAGLGITAVAVSQGSSFWYDLLKKLTGTTAASNPAASDGNS